MTSILRSPGRAAALAAALAVLGGCALTADRLQQGDAHYRMATAYLQQSGGIRNEVNRRQAYSELAQALRLDAKNADYHRLLGAIRLADRNYVGAEQEIRTALKLRADFPEARNDLGSVFAAQGKLTEAVREFRAAAANPSYTTPQFARWNLANASYRLGDYTEAAEAYERYLGTVPDDAEGHFLLGMSNARLGRLAEAERALSTSVRLRAGAPRVRYELGMVLFKLDRRRDAAEQFRAVLELDPQGELGDQARTYLKLLP